MEENEKMRLMGVFDEATEIDVEGWEHVASLLKVRFRFTKRFEEGTPGIVSDIVEGSLVEPITDPTKLLE